MAYAASPGQHSFDRFPRAEVWCWVVNSDHRWFRCYAEVPGAQYNGDPQRRARLPNRNAEPEAHKLQLRDRQVISLSWPIPGGATSASPAHELAHVTNSNESSQDARERVLNALELPGQVLDYHFAMQGVAELLFKRRRAEPQFLAFAEWLCWLDMNLVQANEASFRLTNDAPQLINVLAFDLLLDLYEREGFLLEAASLAERFARYLREDTVMSLRKRVAGLHSEYDQIGVTPGTSPGVML